MIVYLLVLIFVGEIFGAYMQYPTADLQMKQIIAGQTNVDFHRLNKFANSEEVNDEKIRSILLRKLKEASTVSDWDYLQNLVLPPYFVVKPSKHRNKRYISYLTLCHFKICNMGRRRYLKAINSVEIIE